MDDIDRQLLDLIQADSAMSYASLGKHIGLSISAVNERVRKLERRNIIASYGARIDAVALGFGTTAFIKARRLPDSRDLTDQLASHPIVLECHRTSGDADWLLKVRCRTLQELHRFIDDILISAFHLSVADVSLVLHTEKETANIPVTSPVSD